MTLTFYSGERERRKNVYIGCQLMEQGWGCNFNKIAQEGEASLGRGSLSLALMVKVLPFSSAPYLALSHIYCGWEPCRGEVRSGERLREREKRKRVCVSVCTCFSRCLGFCLMMLNTWFLSGYCWPDLFYSYSQWGEPKFILYCEILLKDWSAIPLGLWSLWWWRWGQQAWLCCGHGCVSPASTSPFQRPSFLNLKIRELSKWLLVE